ncbi:MAG: hypothetical protein ABIQ27_07155 [Flavobacterium sp.]|uniref:hypothetical protein n=1 Tax=Flavobacterium sp. TaxID=239 RepID=UPI003263D106
MIKTKDIKLYSNKFQLQYFTNDAIGANINEANCEDIIEVIYAPLPTKSKKEVDQIFKEREQQLLKQIAIVLNENKKFYSKFYISLKLARIKYLYEDNLASTGNVIKTSSFLKITLKNARN